DCFTCRWRADRFHLTAGSGGPPRNHSVSPILTPKTPIIADLAVISMQWIAAITDVGGSMPDANHIFWI
ncbi:MAG: hypothetical protein M3R61_02080, partial [Chloroflexota bacterium]|nr:hypothetical protein [Chloroflexota bacterium]